MRMPTPTRFIRSLKFMAIMGSYTYLLLLEYLFFITSESIKSESALKRQKFVLAGVGLRTNCRYRKRSWTKILKFQLLIHI